MFKRLISFNLLFIVFIASAESENYLCVWFTSRDQLLKTISQYLVHKLRKFVILFLLVVFKY